MNFENLILFESNESKICRCRSDELQDQLSSLIEEDIQTEELTDERWTF